MNPIKQQITIAEACGWKYVNTAKISWFSPDGKERFKCPDYLSDLNACHEMEKVLTYEQMSDYCGWLPKDDWGLIHATASSRAEAFLRCVGKWEEK